MTLAIYTVSLMFSIFAVSGINFNVFIKKNAKWEALFLQVLLSLTMGYCVANLLLDIIGCIKI